MDILDNYIRHHIEKHSHLFSINYKIETFFAKCYDISAEPYLINLESILYNKRIDNLYIGSYRKDDHYYKLFTFIEKTELCSVSKESFNLLGEKLALFHNSFREDNENYSKQVVVYDYEYFSEITLMLNKIRQQNYISQECYLHIKNAVKAIYNEIFFDSKKFQMVHGDFSLDNVLFQSNDVNIIDFDMMGIGPKALDFAIYLNGTRDKTKIKLFLEGYLKYNKIHVSYEELISALLLARLLCISINVQNIRKIPWVIPYINETARFSEKYIIGKGEYYIKGTDDEIIQLLGGVSAVFEKYYNCRWS